MLQCSGGGAVALYCSGGGAAALHYSRGTEMCYNTLEVGLQHCITLEVLKCATIL